jgi:hypothetical protein
MSAVIKLLRDLRTKEGTFGTWLFPTGETFQSVELPDLNNTPRVSCIPDGRYSLGLRHSPVVSRITRGKYKEGWEVQNVPGRTFIMIHPGNWPSNFLGCIGVGLKRVPLQTKTGEMKLGVTQSQLAFDQFMTLMNKSAYWDIEITSTGLKL